MKRSFPTVHLQELADHPVGGGFDEYKKISEDIIDHARWTVDYWMVFTVDGRFYGSRYSRGATERQDERPYEWDGDSIECPELSPQEVTKIEYVPIQD